MIKQDAEDLLNNLTAKPELTSFERAKVEELFHQQGLMLLLGVLLAERQGFLIQLQNCTVADQGGAQRLGVLQGNATGIDRIRHILLECVTVPTDQAS